MIHRKHITGLFLLALVLLLNSVLGISEPVNLWLFDKLIGANPRKSISPELIAVATSADLDSSQLWEMILAMEPERLASIETGDDGQLQVRIIHPPGDSESVFPVSGELPEDGIWRGPASDLSATRRMAAVAGRSVELRGRRLNFAVSIEGIPVIEAGRIVAGGVPKNLLSGKTVLLGDRLASQTRLFTTPIHRGKEALTPLLRETLILDAALQNRWIRPLGGIVSLLTALCLAGVLVLAAFRIRAIGPGRIAAALLAFTIVAAWIMLTAFQTWIAPAESLLAIAGTGLILYFAAQGEEKQTLQRVLRNVVTATRDRAEKDSYLDSQNPWARLEQALGQLYSFEPNLILANTGNGRLAPSEGQREAFEALFGEAEVSSDEGAFALALREGSARIDEVTLLPIRSAEQIHGFWVAGTTGATDGLGEVANQCATMLQNWANWQSDGILSELNGKAFHQHFAAAFDLLEKGKATMTEALNQSRDAVLVFDSSGSLLYHSEPSVLLFTEIGIEPGDLPLCDLLGELSGFECTKIREILKYASIHHQPSEFAMAPGKVEGKEYMVRVKPVIYENRLSDYVILIEDITMLSRTALLKDDFMKSVFFRLNNDFEAILGAANLLADTRLSGDDRATVSELLIAKANHASLSLSGAANHVEETFSLGPVEKYPVRLEPLLDNAIANVKPEAEAIQARIENEVSSYLPLIIASPEPLNQLLNSILEILVQDAREDSTVTVQGEQREDSVVVSFSNDGFGIPPEQLESYLSKPHEGNDPLEVISRGSMLVANWGGQLRVSSRVGAGMKIELNVSSALS